MGAVVLVVAALFLFFAYTHEPGPQRCRATGECPIRKIDGIRDGSDVRIAGVKVGSSGGEARPEDLPRHRPASASTRPTSCPDDTVAEIVSSACSATDTWRWSRAARNKTIPSGGKIKYTHRRSASKT